MPEITTPFPELRSKRKRILHTKILVKSVVYAFAIFGVLFILFLLAILGMLRQEAGMSATVPGRAVLTINFNQSFGEVRNDNLLTEISEESLLSFYDLIKAINVAAMDKRIHFLVGNISVSDLGLAQIQDLRQAIYNFRASGKKAYMTSSGFGALGQGTSEYYLASAFDEIWMQPNSEVGITGLSMEVPFVRALANKVGITPEFYSRYEFKTAADSLTQTQMSAPYRSELEKLGKSIMDTFLTDVSKERGFVGRQLQDLVNQAPLDAEISLQKGLIDRIGYRQELLQNLKQQHQVDEISVENYVLNFSQPKTSKKIAFLVLDGTIAEGKSIDNPLQSEKIVGAETVLKQLDEIAQDKSVKALVLRVNSPGGSYAASQEIWYALKKFKEEKKVPLIVSMGDYAASGGYFISLAGDKIVAEPSSITGSIGVLGGKLVFKDLWAKIDIHWDGVKFGENADILSINKTFSESEKNIFNKSLDRIYEDFTLKVSEAREIPLEKMNLLARGRVWSGADAVQNGLVDEIGGINQALGLAKKMADIKENEKCAILYYPKAKTLQEKIMEVIQSSPSVAANKVKSDFGLDIKGLIVLKRLKYDLALPPFVLNM